MTDRLSLSAGMASIKTAAERIAKSAAIAIVLSEAPGVDALGSAQALVSGLRAAGKTVSVFAPPTLPSPWLASPGAGAQGEPLREFIISFDLRRSPVKELRYERAEERLDIILSPTAGRIRREDVEFRPGALRYDLVITLGVQRPEAALLSIRQAPELLLEKPILNVDVNSGNAGYGELNLIAEGTLAEVTHGLLAALGVPDDAERSSALLSALASATANFNPACARASAFSLAGELMRSGGAVIPIAPPQRSLAGAQLAARAMLRSRLDAERQALVAFITADDFSKTAATSEAVLPALERLADVVPGLERYALAWQEASGRPVSVLTLRRGESGALTAEAAGQDFHDFDAARVYIAQLPGQAGTVE